MLIENQTVTTSRNLPLGERIANETVTAGTETEVKLYEGEGACRAIKRLDPELDVLCCSEDENLLAQEHLFRLLDVSGVSTVEGEKTRGEDGVPSMKIGKTPY